MAFVGLTQRKLSPALTDPRVIVTDAQQSQSQHMFADKFKPMLSDNDMAVYVPTLNLTTEARASQVAGHEKTGLSIMPGLVSAATYEVYIRAPWTRQDLQGGAGWNVSVPELSAQGSITGIARVMANAMLFGVNKGEGLLNSPNAVVGALPADANGNTTLNNYDAGTFRTVIQMMVTSLLTSLNLMGVAGAEVIINTTQRVRSYMIGEVVQLTSQQRAGGGTQSPENAIVGNLGMSGIQVTVVCDDKLAGAGPNGTDGLIITVPKRPTPAGSMFDTNAFGNSISNRNPDINVFYTSGTLKDKTVESTVEQTDYAMWNRITAGWNVVGKGVSILWIDAGGFNMSPDNAVPMMPLPEKYAPTPIKV